MHKEFEMNEILTLLSYPFFRNAFLAVLLISVCTALIGTYIITRRMVALSGGVTHACFGGLGLAYYLGLEPMIGAGVFAIGSALSVDWMSRKWNMREDSAIAVIWAIGMAVGVFFVFLSPGYVPELNAFLFGNILTVNSAELWVFAGYTLVLLAYFALRHKMIIACAFDPDFARVSGLPVSRVNTAMTIMTALCIVLTIRLAGIMMLMSMLSLPMMTAELFSRSYNTILRWAALIALICSMGGLLMSAFVDVPSSAIIVLLMAGVYLSGRVCRFFHMRSEHI